MSQAVSERPAPSAADVQQSRQRTLALLILWIIGVSASLSSGGCTGPWRQHYSAREAASAKMAAAVDNTTESIRVVTKHPSVLWIVDPPRGMVEIGSSRFVAEVEYGPAGLEDLARELGAVEVWLAVEPSGTITRTGVARIPVTDRVRTTGTALAPDGSRNEVDLTTTVQRWEDVPVTTTCQRWLHGARFFALAR